MTWTRNVGLQRRIAFYVVAGLLFLVTVFALVSLRAVNQSSNVILEERLALAQAIAQDFDDHIRTSITQVQATASLLYSTPLTSLSSHEEAMLQALDVRLERQTGGPAPPRQIQLLDSSGNVIWALDEVAGSELPKQPLRQLASDIITSRTTVVRRLASDGNPLGVSIALGAPVVGPRGEVSGVLVAEVAPDADSQLLLVPSGSERRSYRVELVDETGVVVASSDRNDISQPSRHLSMSESPLQGHIEGVWKHDSPGNGIEDHVVSLVPLETVPWTLALEQDEGVALAVPNALRRQILLLAGFGIFGGLILVWLTTRQVVRPLARLTSTAGRIASGDLHTPITIEGQDEVGTLAQSLEAMRRGLEQSLGDIASLLEVARAVEQSLELDQILPGVLDAVLGATTAEAAEVWLLDDQEGTVILRHHRGLAREAFLEITRFGVGEGYPGIVVKTGQPILVHNLPNDHRFLRGQVKTEGFQTFYAIPLRRAGGTIGVLAVAARDPAALTSERELRLLELMAEHIAAAMENARLHEEVETLAIFTERERLAREMHDGLAQVLGYVNTKAQAVKELLKAGRLGDAVQHMEQLEIAAQETYDDVREEILALGTNDRKQPLLESLQHYVERFSDLSGLPTELVIEGPPHSFNPSVEVQLLRIVQEALANARKHAQASRLRVVFSFHSDGCRVVVEDDGRGFDPQGSARGPGPHLGLQSIQERASSIGGGLTLDTAPGRGTRVILDLPEVST